MIINPADQATLLVLVFAFWVAGVNSKLNYR